jgi:hypothetical protein
VTHAHTSVLPICTPEHRLASSGESRKKRALDYVPGFRFFVASMRSLVPSSAARLWRDRWIEKVQSVIPDQLLLYMSQHLEALIAASHFRAGYDGDAPSHAKALRAAAVDLRVLRDGGLAFAYEAHLRVCTYAYLLIFPFTQYGDLGY